MQHFKWLLIITLILSTLTSCDDFLTVLPENNQSMYEFWRTKEEVEAVLGAGYVKLRNTQELLFLWGETRGNGIFFRTNGTEAQIAAQRIRSMDILATNPLARWENLYSVINMANSVIRFGPDVVQRDVSFNENVMRSLLSEAYFQRSLAYFYLVRLWGNVPWVKIPYVDDSAEYALPATPGDEILNACLVDLQLALESAKLHFPETDLNNPINTKGRATRWAILALMADINLYLGNYADVIWQCDEIIQSNRVGLIDTQWWFANFFPGNSNESIFEIQYSNTMGQTNSFLTWFDTNNNYNISPYALTLFTALDRRGLNGSYDATGKIWKFIGINATSRRNASLQNDQNWIVYRLADIYLMKAEALIMQSNLVENDPHLTEALAIINLIRRRAGITDETARANKLGMMSLLIDERQREFLAEGKNWFDLLRLGRRNEPGFKELMIEYATQVVSASNQAMIRAKLNDTNSWYLPIHADELNANSFLTQNPFYENLGN